MIKVGGILGDLIGNLIGKPFLNSLASFVQFVGCFSWYDLSSTDDISILVDDLSILV